MDETIDIALAVEELYGEADYRRAATYTELLATWADARPAPTYAELTDAWVQVQARQQAEAAERAAATIPLVLDDFAAESPAVQGLARAVAWILREAYHGR